MNKVILYIIFHTLILSAKAQINIEPDTTTLQDSVLIEEDSIEIVIWKGFDVQPYLSAMYEVSKNPDGYFESVRGEIGMTYKDNLFISLFATKYQGSYSTLVVFPNQFSLSYQHGGFNIGYKTDSRKRIDLMAGFRSSMGTMLWKYRDSGRDFVKDNVTVLNPYIGIDFNFYRFLKCNMALGYRKMINLEIASLAASDFDGLAGSISIKLGRFNHFKK